jgi:hypothetical protein
MPTTEPIQSQQWLLIILSRSVHSHLATTVVQNFLSVTDDDAMQAGLDLSQLEGGYSFAIETSCLSCVKR